MDRMSGGHNEGFPHDNVFANSQHPYSSYDTLNLFPNGANSNLNDASWGINASDFPNPVTSRAPEQNVPSWQQNANHLVAPSAHAAYNGPASPYGRATNHSPTPYGQNAFNNFGSQQAYPYRQAQQYDPSLVAPSGNSQNFNLGTHGLHSGTPNGGTITPQALQSRPANFGGNVYPSNISTPTYSQALPKRPASTASQARPVDAKALAAAIPKGADSGMFSVINFDNLSRATNSERMGSYVNVGREAQEWDCSRSTIPAYVARKSRNELRALAANNPVALAKIGKKSLKTKSRPTLVSDIKPAGSVASPSRIKYEGGSGSSEDSSSDDDSEYSDEDESDSPLPSNRPDTPRGGVEYDTIKALWRSKRKSLDSETIRKSLVDFWELVKTIRDRWKVDAAAVTDAEEKKRMGELPLLQSRVKDQRDMMEAAFKAALKHGHRGIVELFGENVSLVFVCYQFLLDRFKAEDHNGSLARSILETMSTFTTLTKDKIEKTHLVKVLPRYQKKGDAKTQWWVKRIIENAETATKEAATKSEQKKSEKSTADSGDTKTASPPAKRTAEPSVGVKRAAPSSPDGAVQKKVATAAGKQSGAVSGIKSNGIVKKQASAGEEVKLAGAGNAPATARKTVVAKPSGFFSSLNSASKKPGTSISDKISSANAKSSASRLAGATSAAPKPTFSFAETMANLSKPKEEKPAPKPQKDDPEETAEEREKRLKKEKRKKLHVQFKPPEELVEIRYFTHDPQEEIDHDSSQMRDVADVGGEGRMFKQQAHMMDIDDEDEASEEGLRDHRPPPPIDFGVVDKEERKRNYAPFGGGEMEVDSTERVMRDAYENSNLMVFYADPSQIPPNPREPNDPNNGDQGEALKYFGAPEEKFAARARVKIAQQKSTQRPDEQQGQYGSTSSVPDITAILANLAQTTHASYQQPQQPAPAMNASFNYQHQTPAPAQPTGALDLGAILAQLNQQAGQQSVANAAPIMSFGQQPPQMIQVGAQHDSETSDPNKPYVPYKTKPCRFWQSGRCQKGDACTYLHE